VQKRIEFVLDQDGKPVAGATVQVNLYPGGGAATLYSDNGVTPKANPVTTDSKGRYEYYAANGHYSEIVTTSAGAQPAINDIILNSPYDLEGSKTFDPGNLGAGLTQQTTVTVTGAALGDHAEAMFSLAHADIVWLAEVTATDTVTVTQWNRGAGGVDLTSGTLKAFVRKA
jgi:hypothetical protein